MARSLPSHLSRYIVEQDETLYTPEDHSVWRYILRQLQSFLSQHAHPCYLDGLKKTGISTDRIPKISEISKRLEEFGWKAVPVSGFIPPAAFMELQSFGYLPIASDMRTLNHLMYTPAPDIVHEAAGHAPILIDSRFAEYLKAYAQVAKNAIISKEDMDQYEAIRVLSDLKEHPATTEAQILEAERRLDAITKNITHISEAARLGRMNWWTAEYGLIGSLENPKIFGAGLLSSVGEARSCLSEKVRKIPLTIECVEYGYDITEPQPQLFVTPNFENLVSVLEDLANTMAFRTGTISALDKIVAAQTVNTVVLDSELQISGRLTNWIRANSGGQSEDQKIAYLQFTGPSQLCLDGAELAGHGVRTHAHGFGTPLGHLKSGPSKPLWAFDDSELARLGIRMGLSTTIEFESGVKVRGTIKGLLRSPKGRLLLISWTECTVTYDSQMLFDPAWGSFDMAVGSSVVSVFGGPADRESFGKTEDFVAKRVPKKEYSAEVLKKFEVYATIQKVRETFSGDVGLLTHLFERAKRDAPSEWLLLLEILELSEKLSVAPPWKDSARRELETLAQKNADLRAPIEDGLKIVSQVW